ncbi:SsgA family sporulation/cell division regulator [Kitasatospora sp. NPDC089797]|uniref:SsgA family sporulation/cell division regulator n=1 Tax=Kitasatospora sp. NPDC089797 TaxID=3155298 RepID=UPI00342F5AEB
MQNSTILGHMLMRLVVSTVSTRLVSVDLRYEASDPYAVQLAFRRGRGAQVTWHFGRELLIDGLTRPVGEGDVRIGPTDHHPPEVSITLKSTIGSALLLASCGPLNAFLDRTDSLVPVGYESVEQDIDAQLERILRGA